MTDPVCGMNADDVTAPKSTHDGKNYAFCSDDCKAQFDKNPGNYTAAREKASK